MVAPRWGGATTLGHGAPRNRTLLFVPTLGKVVWATERPKSGFWPFSALDRGQDWINGSTQPYRGFIQFGARPRFLKLPVHAPKSWWNGKQKVQGLSIEYLLSGGEFG